MSPETCCTDPNNFLHFTPLIVRTIPVYPKKIIDVEGRIIPEGRRSSITFFEHFPKCFRRDRKFRVVSGLRTQQ